MSDCMLCNCTVGKRATNGKKLRVQGSVKSTNGSSGYLKYVGKGNSEKRARFHINDVAEKLELGIADEVAFNLCRNPKSRELTARSIVRVKVCCLGCQVF